MADPISGELVIVPKEDMSAYTYDWADAVAFAASYDDGTNSDYRLITRAEAKAIIGNSELVSQLGWNTYAGYWTIEEFDTLNAYKIEPPFISDDYDLKTYYYYAQPVRKVNFYGLPLIDSEFGGGLVYDVVAETRTVHVVAKPAELGDFNAFTWESATGILPAEINGVLFTSLPTRAQALKIFGNSYLVTLAGLPVDDFYWTSEDVGAGGAWCFDPSSLSSTITNTGSLNYALPVRSEVVPET